ncbi:peptidoglycan-binding protein [Teichococcus wenyumeiae]|uniref:peptidoglycan-binding protein n=1 Tax=Teichococcus wenyumeiae TaxID=2478470 RepID=UPI00131592D5|nr:peptidoglycan-binding protein [Pseudoroseomonas wenyumeiae]
MTRCRLAAAALLLGAAPALAETAPPPRLALVIGNAAYAEAPPLPACATSARLAAQTLEARGYAVTLREDLSHGEMAAAFRALGQALDRAPGAQAVAYLCTRAVASGGRAFLLPVTARVQRPSDAISQGILASRLAEALDRPDEGDALMLVDAMTGPAGDAAAWQDAVSRTSSRVGLAVALPEPAPETGPAPLAGSLRTLIPDGGSPMVDLSAALRQQLAPRPGLTLVLHAPAVPVPKPPAGPLPLAALQPPALPEAPAAPAAAAPIAPAPSAEAPAPPPAADPPAPPAAEPPAPPALPPPAAAAISPEPPTNLAQRRFIQDVLRRLGYYDGLLDGVFGPGARAAIRRYQRETGVAPTGLLTPDQARRLLSTQQRAGAV